MTFTLKDFETLQKNFTDTATIFLKRRNVRQIRELKGDTERRDELLLLSSTLKELDRIMKDTKAQDQTPYQEIYYGAMLVLRRYAVHHQGVSSQFYDSMNLTINDKGNPPTPQQQASYIQAFNDFLKLIYVNEDSTQGLKTKHALDSISIEKLISFIRLSYQLEKEVCLERIKAIENPATTKATKTNIDEVNNSLTNVNQYPFKKQTSPSAVKGFESFERYSFTR